MNQLAINKSKKILELICNDSLTMAERELGAFFNAVMKSFGSRQASISAEEWMQELMAANVLPSTTGEWRLLTVKVLSRIAGRLNAAAIPTASASLTYADQSSCPS